MNQPTPPPAPSANGHDAPPVYDLAAPARKVTTTLGGGRRVRIDPDLQLVGALRPSVARQSNVQVVAEAGGDNELSYAAALPARERADSFVRLAPLTPRETFWQRWPMLLVALAFSGLYLWAMLGYWAPAHTGVDQNGYLVGGRLIAEHGTMSYVPQSPYGFVGNMWVATDRPETTAAGETVQEYFPKYPAGLPLIYASFFWLAPTHDAAVEWAELVSPVAAALAVLGMFFLGRFAGGSFLGALAMLGLAGSQLLLQLADNPNSHAAALAFVIWGFVALLAWWRSGFFLWGICGGLLLGYAFTIRYTEGLLGLPLGLACVFAWQWRRPFASGLRVALPLIAWAVPVAALLAYNKHTMGTLTGYDSTGEAGGFSLDNAAANWQTMAKQLNDAGLYLLLPLGVAGLLALCARRLKLGLVVLSWFVGTVAIYTAYYWAPDNWGSIAYLRFFLTAFPAALFGAAYLLRRLLYAPSDAPPQVVEARDPWTGRTAAVLVEPPVPWWRGVASPLAAGLVVAASIGLGTHRAVGALPGGESGAFAEPGLQMFHNLNVNVAELGRVVRRRVPQDAVLIVDSPGMLNNVIHHLQFVGDYEIYDAAVFTNRFAKKVGGQWDRAGDADNPNPLQKKRYEFLHDFYAGKADADLSAGVREVVDRALDQGRPVYLLMNDIETRRFRQSHLLDGYDVADRGGFQYTPVTRPKLQTDRDEDAPDADKAKPRRRPKPTLMGMMGGAYAAMNTWQLSQVTREPPIPPAVAPASAPATRPAR